ncbi:MAG: DNA polymerase IV [Candidatus Doudnabacteria bacterium]|nr:DNA polymerase IV [Candidatus Doudnabacteria bacterium]
MTGFTKYSPPKNKFDHRFRGIMDGSRLPHIMLLDMNSFFASVEQQANPFFRGKPLGVCASLHKTSCLIAASKEAKKTGIRTGTLIWKAQQICPEIILVESEPAKYREVNQRVNKILSEYTDKIESYSIDESFLDLSDSKINPLEVAVEVKRRIVKEVGEALTCSVGIGPNKFIAKLASDMYKPDGLTVIWRDQLPEVYKNLKLTDLWGIARGWSQRLARLGINSPLEVLSYPLSNMISSFGKPGYYIWQRINGLEVDEISSAEDPPKSFGHSWVLNFRSKDKKKLAPAVMRLAEKAARRMRHEDFKARGMYLSIRMADGTGYHQSKKLDRDIETGLELFEEAMCIWKHWNFHSEVAHIAVGFFSLFLRTEQLPLFGQRKKHLNDSLDHINNKYGEFTIRSGLLVHTQDYAPDAIAFGR